MALVVEGADIAQAVLDNPRDKCTVSLLYANKSIDDILVGTTHGTHYPWHHPPASMQRLR